MEFDDEEYYWEDPVIYDLTVEEESPHAEFTGLISPEGRPIMRIKSPRPKIGFLSDDDFEVDTDEEFYDY